jgi:hypothetical protein
MISGGNKAQNCLIPNSFWQQLGGNCVMFPKELANSLGAQSLQ